MKISALMLVAAVSVGAGACGSEPEAMSVAPVPESAVALAGRLEPAARTALKTVPGGTLTSIETEGPGWEVQVVTADGTEHELMVSANGDRAVRNDVKREGPAGKDEHRKRVKAAKLDYRAAANQMHSAVPNSSIAELNLDTYRGTTVWEGDLEDSGGAKREVKIDAASGKVLIS
ncbi:PepSY domain-containing protein [Spirillospora sp. NPDC048911]|uniref:PepSY domain-containing protein n=1 Tax=Spirillospora sp. NPDC048911 TaxID=3364527 RepID=UPI0037241969